MRGCSPSCCQPEPAELWLSLQAATGTKLCWAAPGESWPGEELSPSQSLLELWAEQQHGQQGQSPGRATGGEGGLQHCQFPAPRAAQSPARLQPSPQSQLALELLHHPALMVPFPFQTPLGSTALCSDAAFPLKIMCFL